jgi:hypothetical protein
MKEAMDAMNEVYGSGYAASDVIQTLFKVGRIAFNSAHQMYILFHLILSIFFLLFHTR